jgi:hypothetical protein
VLASATCAAAQSGSGPVQWLSDPQQAVRAAQNANRPLLVWIIPPQRERVPIGDGDKLENRQEHALRESVVVRQMRKFVPLRLNRGAYRDAARDFGFSEAAGFEIRFVTPDGQSLGAVPSSDVAVAETLARRMAVAFEDFVKRVYTRDVQPNLKAALKLVSEFRIAAADRGVIALLERERLDAGARTAVYEALAAVSTKDAVGKLLDLARGGDAGATKALEKVTPVGAELLAAELKPDAPHFDYLVYRIVTRASRVSYAKPERFFDNADTAQKTEEVQRVSDVVKQAAEKWKAEND